jgi:hypothetical protein
LSVHLGFVIVNLLWSELYKNKGVSMTPNKKVNAQIMIVAFIVWVPLIGRMIAAIKNITNRIVFNIEVFIILVLMLVLFSSQ